MSVDGLRPMEPLPSDLGERLDALPAVPDGPGLGWWAATVGFGFAALLGFAAGWPVVGVVGASGLAASLAFESRFPRRREPEREQLLAEARTTWPDGVVLFFEFAGLPRGAALRARVVLDKETWADVAGQGWTSSGPLRIARRQVNAPDESDRLRALVDTLQPGRHGRLWPVRDGGPCVLDVHWPDGRRCVGQCNIAKLSEPPEPWEAASRLLFDALHRPA